MGPKNPTTKITQVRILDSSLIIEADRLRLTKRLSDYLSRNRIQTIVPTKVKQETVDEPRSIPEYSKSANRIDRLIFRSNAVSVEDPDYRDGRTCTLTDRIRDCIAKKSGKFAHLVERADLEFVTLALNHMNRNEKVELVFRDNALDACIKSILTSYRYANKLMITPISAHIDSL
ncbi:MAG TPA: hypothetical protein VJZ32_12740 [Candidatus Bathyarchaeia archaeon]|nr:hypothetical protein [Candidatus Bathyarchaeia archaeon]